MSENFFPFIVVGGFAVVLISVVISIALEEGETGGSFLMAKKPTCEELEQRVKELELVILFPHKVSH